MDIGRLGCWTWLDGFPAREAAAFARRLEDWGYGALWIPEAVGRDPFSTVGYLAAHTERLVFATGIANIYARDPMTLRAVAHTLCELSDDRFILGLGVSHAPLVQGIRGHEYKKPLTTMRNTLEGIDKALYMGPSKEKRAPIVIAALRGKMLALAAEKCAGAHPYNSPPEHTARAREIMGEGPLLCPDQKAILETDASKARAIGRAALATYLELPNYQNNWKDLGFDDDDFRDHGSDRLIDAVFAWGDEQAIGDRIQAHLDAGADHVCLQPVSADASQGPDEKILEIFAPAKQ